MKDSDAHRLTFGEWKVDVLDMNIESVSTALDVVNIDKSSETYCHTCTVDACRSEIWRHVCSVEELAPIVNSLLLLTSSRTQTRN